MVIHQFYKFLFVWFIF